MGHGRFWGYKTIKFRIAGILRFWMLSIMVMVYHSFNQRTHHTSNKTCSEQTKHKSFRPSFQTQNDATTAEIFRVALGDRLSRNLDRPSPPKCHRLTCPVGLFNVSLSPPNSHSAWKESANVTISNSQFFLSFWRRKSGENFQPDKKIKIYCLLFGRLFVGASRRRNRPRVSGPRDGGGVSQSVDDWH